MKKKILFFAISLFIISAVIISCRKNDVGKTEVVEIQAKDYSMMTAAAKKDYEVKMISILKQDENYIELNKNLQKVINYHIGAPSLNFVKKKLPKKGNDLIRYYKELGISNPEDYYKTKVLILRGMAQLNKAYPELFKLDAKVRRHIMVDAAKPVKVVTALKLRLQESKN